MSTIISSLSECVCSCCRAWILSWHLAHIGKALLFPVEGSYYSNKIPTRHLEKKAQPVAEYFHKAQNLVHSLPKCLWLLFLFAPGPMFHFLLPWNCVFSLNSLLARSKKSHFTGAKKGALKWSFSFLPFEGNPGKEVEMEVVPSQESFGYLSGFLYVF